MPDVLQVQRPGEGEPTKPEWPEVAYGANPPKRARDGGRIALPWQALALLLAFVLIVGGGAYWRYDTYCAGYSNPCWWHGPLVSSMLVLVPLATLLAWLWGYTAERQARAQAAQNEARRLALVGTRYGNNEPLSLYEQPVADAVQFFMARYLTDTQLEQAIAPSKIYSGVDTLNEGAKTEVRTDLGAPPALPAPEEDRGLVPADTFLPWLMELHHTMIAGATGSGKTTFARIALGERLRMGYSGLVVDPKGKDWYGLPVIGGGRKFADILATLDGVRLEMDRRFDAYGRGVRDFEPLVVLVDEVPDIMEACRDERRRVVDGRWMRFVKQLGSLAREVQISVILLTQSPLVEDVGMNSAMRKNFTRVALGDEAPILVREERDAERRRELAALLKGQQFPAALYRRGEVHLLDTGSVPQLADRPVRDAQGWQPSPVAPQNGHAPALDKAAVQRKALERAIALGWTRDQARASGLRFDNNVWTRLGGL